MNYKLKLPLIVIFAVASINVMAQGTFQIGEYRSYARPEKYANISGQPYLFKDWALGNVTTVDNASRKNVMLRFDEIEDQLIIKGEGGEEQMLSLPVKEFTVTDVSNNIARKFKSGFTATKLNKTSTLFEVLVEGKASLLRKNTKIISENKEYSGNINRTVVDGVKHYLVLADNTPVLVKLDAKTIISLLVTKESELNSYIKENKLNVKKQDDAMKLINYYNSL